MPFSFHLTWHLRSSKQPGAVARTCSPSYSGGWVRTMAWAQMFETSLGKIATPISKNALNKVDQPLHSSNAHSIHLTSVIPHLVYLLHSGCLLVSCAIRILNTGFPCSSNLDTHFFLLILQALPGVLLHPYDFHSLPCAFECLTNMSIPEYSVL
jgi:hypothetical protein